MCQSSHAEITVQGIYDYRRISWRSLGRITGCDRNKFTKFAREIKFPAVGCSYTSNSDQESFLSSMMSSTCLIIRYRQYLYRIFFCETNGPPSPCLHSLGAARRHIAEVGAEHGAETIRHGARPKNWSWPVPCREAKESVQTYEYHSLPPLPVMGTMVLSLLSRWPLILFCRNKLDCGR